MYNSTNCIFKFIIMNKKKKKLQIKKKKKNKENAVLITHQKKIRNLTKYSTNLFIHSAVVKNLSSKHLTKEELDLLKFDLQHFLPPPRVYKTNVFVLFEMINRFLLEEIDKPALKTELLHFANSDVHNFKPCRSTLGKHGILKKLKNDTSIVILQPDRGNDIVVLARFQYDNAINERISDKKNLKNFPKTLLLIEKLSS